MLDIRSFFSDMKSATALRCGPGLDDTDLARTADVAITREVAAISALPDQVGALWTWLEKKPIKIYSRFLFQGPKTGVFDEKSEILELSKQIKQTFKKGASGAQIFIPRVGLEYFASAISPIKNDLFFNKKLCIGLDPTEIESFAWPDIFNILSSMGVSEIALDFSCAGDTNFVGQVYGLLDSLPVVFPIDLHFFLGDNAEKMEQVWRLTEKIRPEISNKLKFFINV